MESNDLAIFDAVLGAGLICYALYRLIKLNKNIKLSNIISSLAMIDFGVFYLLYMFNPKLLGVLWIQITLGSLLVITLIFGLIYLINCIRNKENIFKKLGE